MKRRQIKKLCSIAARQLSMNCTVGDNGLMGVYDTVDFTNFFWIDAWSEAVSIFSENYSVRNPSTIQVVRWLREKG